MATIATPDISSPRITATPSRNTSPNFTSLYPLGTLGRFGVSDTDLEHDGQNIGAWLKQVMERENAR